MASNVERREMPENQGQDIFRKVKKVMAHIGCGGSVARELLVLAGWDDELVLRMSNSSSGLDQCKARIINERFNRLETK